MVFPYSIFLGSIVAKTPSQIAGLQVWYKADAGITISTGVSVWADQSGNGNNAVQATSGLQPALISSALNSLPVVRLDGSDDYLTLSEVTARTFFIVLKEDSSVPSASYKPILGHSSLYDFHRGDDKEIFVNSSSNAYLLNGKTHINGIPVDPSTTVMPTAYSIVSFVATGDVKFNNISQDRGVGGRAFKGDYAEIIAYSSSLSTKDRRSVSKYLKDKYNL